MTPEQRRAARELTEKVKAFEGEHPFAASPVTRNLEAALDQLDADEKQRKDDEGLLRQANRVVIQSLLRLDFDGCEDVKAEMVSASHALRARLGDPAPEVKP